MKTFKLLCIGWLIASYCSAGSLNIVNVSGVDPINLSFTVDGQPNAFEVRFGAASGFFYPPESVNIFTSDEESIPALLIPTGESSHLAVLYRKNDKLLWKTIPVKLGIEGWSLKVFNFTGKPVKLLTKEGLIKLEDGKEVKVAVTKKEEMEVVIPDVLDRKYAEKQATVVSAIIYEIEDEKKVVFVD